MLMYGRDDEVWDRLAEPGLSFLIELARLGKVTSYTELNAALIRRTGIADQLAADMMKSLIERYLAEFRNIVVTDPELLTAIRSVLDAFVRIGWPAAVALSYRLGDAFR